MQKHKAIIFDIDDTLTNSTSWLELTRILGADSETHSRIYSEFVDNKLSYEEAKSDLVKLWRSTGNANKTKITKAFENIILKKDAKKVVTQLSKKFKICLITGSMDLFANVIAGKLEIEDYFYNTELIFDNDELVDFNYVADQSNLKLEQSQIFCEKYNLKSEEVIIVGDGGNDQKLFDKYGLSVQVGNQYLDITTDHKINELSELIEIVNE